MARAGRRRQGGLGDNDAGAAAGGIGSGDRLESGEPQAERRLERLRRRWITQNADAIRAFQRERTTLQNELLTLEARYDALQQRSVTLKAAEAALADKQSAWEEKHLHAEARERRLEQELQHAETQRELAQQHSLALRDEVERIARALLDEPDPPLAPVVLPRAA